MLCVPFLHELGPLGVQFYFIFAVLRALFPCSQMSLFYLKTCTPLKTLTSLNKEVRPFFLSDNSIWSFPLFLPLAITAFGGPEGDFSLAIRAFRAFGFIVPKYYYRLGKMDKMSLDSLL